MGNPAIENFIKSGNRFSRFHGYLVNGKGSITQFCYSADSMAECLKQAQKEAGEGGRVLSITVGGPPDTEEWSSWVSDARLAA